MRKQVLIFVLGFAVALVLFGGNRTPVVLEPVTAQVAKAQSANPRGDLVTKLRQDVNNINSSFDAFISHRGEYVSANVNFVVGDLAGNNVTSPSTFVADDVDQVIVDLNDIITKIKAGGTISVGEWTNVMKIR